MATGPETAPDCERPRARHRTWGRWSGDVAGLRPAYLDGVSWSPRLAQAFRLVPAGSGTYGCGSAPESDRLPPHAAIARPTIALGFPPWRGLGGTRTAMAQR